MKKVLLILITTIFYLPVFSQITDYDGNVYDTVRIGEQTWLKENLKSLHYFDGTAISKVYVWDDIESNADVYGRYYEWPEAMRNVTNEKAKGVCPDRWHIPSLDEWKELAGYLGGSSVAGGKMKVEGTEYWDAPNTDATNSSGFSAIGAGEWNGEEYWLLHVSAIFWSSTMAQENKVTYPYLTNESAAIYATTWYDTLAYSVRCIKDRPDITVSEVSGQTNEGGRAATFTIKLESEPLTDVVIDISSSNEAEATVAPATLTFTKDNWFLNQTVTVTGVDDDTVDGDIAYEIILNVNEESDEWYANITPDNIELVNQDNDETVGISEINKMKKLEIFPNPSKEFVNVILSDKERIEGVELYSVTGKKQNADVTIKNNMATINLTECPNGVYLIKVDYKTNSVTEKIIIKK